MYYTIYRIINRVNSKFYIGKHQTENPYDEYLGSGKFLKTAIKKYGRKNFTKEVLFVFFTEDEMNFKEAELITEDLIKNPLCYNAGLGGEGGPHFKGCKHSEETKQKLRVIATEKGKKVSSETRQKLSENNWAKRDPEAQRAHAKLAGKVGSSRSKRNPEKTSASLKEYYSNNPCKTKGSVKPKKTCPYCGKQGAKNTMVRWHFDNCRDKSSPRVN